MSNFVVATLLLSVIWWLWHLDTIKQEAKLCYLYEKCGYVATGKEEDIKDGMTIVYYQKRLY